MSLNEAKVTACWHKWILKNKHKSEKRFLTPHHLLSCQPQLSGPPGFYIICVLFSHCDFESGPACLIQVTDQLITAWGARVSNRRQGRGHHPAREKKLVPSVLLNINRLISFTIFLPSIFHLWSRLVLTRSQDISNDSFNNLSTVCLEPVFELLGRTRNLIPFH